MGVFDIGQLVITFFCHSKYTDDGYASVTNLDRTLTTTDMLTRTGLSNRKPGWKRQIQMEAARFSINIILTISYLSERLSDSFHTDRVKLHFFWHSLLVTSGWDSCCTVATIELKKFVSFEYTFTEFIYFSFVPLHANRNPFKLPFWTYNILIINIVYGLPI